jgi:hypothetical protein
VALGAASKGLACPSLVSAEGGRVWRGFRAMLTRAPWFESSWPSGFFTLGRAYLADGRRAWGPALLG